MSEILAADEMIREIFEKYNKRPLGWKVASDLKGNTIVVGPDSGYRLKAMAISPYENIGYGARFDPKELEGSIDTYYQFGFRPVPADLLAEILKINTMGTETEQGILGRILKKEPSPLDRIGPNIGGILGGPFLQHPDLRLVSKAQQELDEKLRMEVDREFIRRHPLRASIYR